MTTMAPINPNRPMDNNFANKPDINCFLLDSNFLSISKNELMLLRKEFKIAVLESNKVTIPVIWRMKLPFSKFTVSRNVIIPETS